MRHTYFLSQLDKKLKKTLILKHLVFPKEGWLSVIRKTLCMSRAQMASRLHVTRDAIQKIEQSEVAQTISLSTLQKTASVLGCDVYYVLLPKDKSLSNFVAKQAEKVAKKIVLNSAKHMALEDQNAQDKIGEQVKIVIDEILHKSLKDLWKHEV